MADEDDIPGETPAPDAPEGGEGADGGDSGQGEDGENGNGKAPAANAADFHGGQVEDLLIEDDLKRSYLTYAMSVIVSRALPDARDGLKPSQRRILYAMNELNLQPRAKFRKCALIVGDTMGKYHPHGDQAIYSTLARLAQDWNTRYLMVQG